MIEGHEASVVREHGRAGNGTAHERPRPALLEIDDLERAAAHVREPAEVRPGAARADGSARGSVRGAARGAAVREHRPGCRADAEHSRDQRRSAQSPLTLPCARLFDQKLRVVGANAFR